MRQGEGLQDDLWLEQRGVTLGDREEEERAPAENEAPYWPCSGIKVETAGRPEGM